METNGTIEYNGKAYFPLKGFEGYYATTEGRVLSVKKGVKLLKPTTQDSYILSKDNHLKHITRGHIAYMVQNNCYLCDIPEKYVYFKDGKAIATHEINSKRALKPKVPGETPIKRIEFAEKELSILKRFYTTKKIKDVQEYLKSKESLLMAYAMRTLNKGLARAKELVQDAMTEFVISLYKGLCTYSIFSYVKKIMRNMTAKEKNERKHFKEVGDYTFGVCSSRMNLQCEI